MGAETASILDIGRRNKIVMKNTASQFLFKLIITMLFSYVSGQQRMNDNNKIRQITRNFDHHADATYIVGRLPRWSTSRA